MEETSVYILSKPSDETLRIIKSYGANCSIYTSDLTWLDSSYKAKIFDNSKAFVDSFENAFSILVNISELTGEKRDPVKLLQISNNGNSWWYYFRFMCLYKFRQRLYDDYSLKAILLHHQNTGNGKIVIVSNSGYLKSAIPTHIEVIKATFEKRKNETFGNLLKYLIALNIRLIIGWFLLPKLLIRRKNVLVSSAYSAQKVLLPDGTEKYGDQYSEGLQAEFAKRKRHLNLTEFFPPALKSSIKVNLNSRGIFPRYRNEVYIEPLLFLNVMNPVFYIKAAKYLRTSKRAIAHFTSLKLEGDLKHVPVISSSFKRLISFLSVRMAAIDMVLAILKPEWIGGSNEHDVRMRSIIESVKKKGKSKSFAVQHGSVHTKHLHYIFSKGTPTKSILPDVTFTWGSFWSDVLTKDSAYPPEIVRELGQIRTDTIPELLTKTTQTKNEFGINFNKRIVLYGSQLLHPGEHEKREQLAVDFIKTAKQHPNDLFIVKPHPKEDDAEKFFAGIARKHDVLNVQVYRSDLYKMLSIADMVLVYNSTVGVETTYFDKPLIVLNYYDNDFGGFIKDGVGVEVMNYDEMQSTISGILAGKIKKDDEAYKKFVVARATAIDGQVCKRIADELV